MRGVLGQLVVLTWAPALTMGNFKLISFRTAGDIIGVSSAVLLAIDLLFLYLRKRSRATRDGD
jgi:tetrahydromethanopterin S-methyltransferase subunit F